MQHYSRRNLLKSAGLGAASLALCPVLRAADKRPKKRMNIVFILVDDLGYMDVSPYNADTFYDTPNIKRLARNSMRFTNGYAACPVCSPTRFSIQTGKYPTRTDATNFFSGKRVERFRPAPLHNRMDLEELTMAEALKKHGYSTFFAGKWHLGHESKYWPENQGYDVNKGGWAAGGPYGGNKYFSPYGNPRLEDGPKGEHLPDRLATETCEFMQKNKNKPFFAMLSFYSVHIPLMGRKDLVKKYRAKREKLGLDDMPRDEKFNREEQNFNTDRKRYVRVVQDHAVYAAMVEAMDAAVGKVLDKLDELDLSENTAVVFMSDNGGLSTSEGSPTANVPLRGGKGWLYEGGIREPFMIRWPSVTNGGADCHEPVTSTDFYPTLLDMAGLPLQPKQHLDGVSLVPLLHGEKNFDREALYWHYPHYANQGGFPGGAIRMGDWKLLERYEDGRVHLYNLAEDIGEQNDLAEKHPDRVKSMRAKLHKWYKTVDAKFLRPKKPGGPKPWKP